METVAAGITRHAERLTTGLSARGDCELLSSTDPGQRAGIVTFRPRQVSSEALYRALQAAGVVCAARGGGVRLSPRLSPHFWHADADIDAALERIDTAVAGLS